VDDNRTAYSVVTGSNSGKGRPLWHWLLWDFPVSGCNVWGAVCDKNTSVCGKEGHWAAGQENDVCRPVITEGQHEGRSE
jgi:hypothetical protein